jgi:hypothetical protein
MIYITKKHLPNVEPDMLVNLETDFPEEKVMAVSRTRLNLDEAPTGKRLEAIKQMMMRVHRASGHSGFSNLQKLLEARGSPKWAIELAGTLTCPECQEASKPAPRPPAGTDDGPALFEMLGTDVVEYEHNDIKYEGILWRDRASGLTMIDILHQGDHWEPKTADIIKSLARWMMSHPSPTWIVADAARYYTSWEFEHLGRSGVGLTIAPGEAHWIMGAEEQAIGYAKKVVGRLLQEESPCDVPTLFHLAAHAMNSHVGTHGFNAYQWVYGKDYVNASLENLPPGLKAGKAFGGLLKTREKARLAFERERESS